VHLLKEARLYAHNDGIISLSALSRATLDDDDHTSASAIEAHLTNVCVIGESISSPSVHLPPTDQDTTPSTADAYAELVRTPVDNDSIDAIHSTLKQMCEENDATAVEDIFNEVQSILTLAPQQNQDTLMNTLESVCAVCANGGATLLARLERVAADIFERIIELIMDTRSVVYTAQNYTQQLIHTIGKCVRAMCR
jgi:hypothetical protein